ncbi:MAG: ATP-binding cassette domain-containing protein [Sphingomonadales bacterium]|nr:ATP-binding cassette domain-containing protein [Sphingomonadales bacterium]
MVESGSEPTFDLRLNGGSKRFERGWLFKNLNFIGRASERWAITGPNGSGKSTLLLSLGGYIELTEGRISLRCSGRDWPDVQISRFTVLASPYLDLPASLTISELFHFHQQLKGVRLGWNPAEQLGLSGLNGHLYKKTAQLSSGQRQKLRLLLAFGCAAPVLLLDEPCSHLDQQGFDWYHSLLSQPFLGEVLLLVASNEPTEHEGMRSLIDLSKTD